MARSFIIVGSGVFGLSTALALSSQDPDCIITIVDRYEPPVPDGASVDSSRIVRADYSDKLYASLATAAREFWRTDDQLKHAYHECGMLLNTADDVHQCGYLDKSLATVRALNIEVKELEGDELMQTIHGKDLPEHLRDLGLRGYLNPIAGFADAKLGIQILYERAKLSSKINFVFEAVESLHYADDARTIVRGVILTSGVRLSADTIILATGAWQLPDVPVPTVASGQVLGYIDLTDSEVERYKTMPIIINFSTGWFCIPPYQGQIKVARHAEGYLYTQDVIDKEGKNSRRISVPRTSLTHGSQQIPKEGEDALREGLRMYLPDLADKKFSNTRVCWYSDTPRADFLIDWYPKVENLFVCLGGSGHAYKMLPILGDLIVSVLNGKANDTLKEKWSFEAAYEAQSAGSSSDGSRGKGGLLEWDDIA